MQNIYIYSHHFFPLLFEFMSLKELSATMTCITDQFLPRGSLRTHVPIALPHANLPTTLPSYWFNFAPRIKEATMHRLNNLINITARFCWSILCSIYRVERQHHIQSGTRWGSGFQRSRGCRARQNRGIGSPRQSGHWVSPPIRALGLPAYAILTKDRIKMEHLPKFCRQVSGTSRNRWWCGYSRRSNQ